MLRKRDFKSIIITEKKEFDKARFDVARCGIISKDAPHAQEYAFDQIFHHSFPYKVIYSNCYQFLPYLNITAEC